MPEHTGRVQPCCAGTKRRISAVLWFSLNPCGLNLCSTVATWGDGIPKKGAVPCCVPPQLLRGAFLPRAHLVVLCLVTFPRPVWRELCWVGHAAVQRHWEHSMGKVSALVPGIAVLSH